MVWSNATACDATGAKSSADWIAGNVVMDSRVIQRGDIFVALKGESRDGHDFVNQAAHNGAACCIISRPMKVACPTLLVPDTYEALYQLARYNRARYKGFTATITGSIGKTSARDMINLAFSACGKSFSSRENYNNHVGHPINLASMTEDAKLAIFEIGMNHLGEIEPLAELTKADIAIITNVYATHIGFFKSIQEIADAKAEIFTGTTRMALLNKSNEFFDYLTVAAKKHGLEVHSFGDKTGDAKLVNFTIDQDGAKVKAEIFGKKIAYFVPTISRYQILNSVIALAAVYLSDNDIELASKKFAEYRVPEGRGRVHKLKFRGKNITLIDDSYNCSPQALKQSLELFRSYPGKRHVAILGDMGELGDDALKYHLDLQEHMTKAADKLILVGKYMKIVYGNIPKDQQLFYGETVEEIIANLHNLIQDEDCILIKSSKSTGLRKIAQLMVQ